MRAAVTRSAGVIEIAEVPEPPEPQAGEVVVRSEAVGICGSDFHFLAGELDIFESSPFPRVQGHEVAGTIETLGPGCREELRPGARVALHPLSACGRCHPCAVGRPNVCDNFNLIGIHTDGGLQERLRIPESQVFPVAAGTPAVAAMAEPISIGVRAVRRAALGAGERAVVLGAGPIGQAIHLLARERGAATLLVDRLESRLEIGARTGAETLAWSDPEEVGRAATEWAGGDGPPVVFDATGAPAAVRAAVDMAASAGRVIVVGMSGEEVPLRVGSFPEKELDLLGVSCCNADEFAEAVAFVDRKGERIEPLITHELPLVRAPEALGYAMDNPAEVMKVVIRTDEAGQVA